MPKIPVDTEKRISAEFKERVLELMEDAELNKKQLAKEAEISNEIISRITIYGIIPSVRTLIKLAERFEVSLPYLLAETDTNDFIKSDSPVAFAVRMKQLSEESGLKYSQIAKNMPFSVNYMYEWEREGTLPSLEYLYALAGRLKVSPDYLLGRTDYKN